MDRVRGSASAFRAPGERWRRRLLLALLLSIVASVALANPPKPAKSEYLKSTAAGFGLVDAKGAQYAVTFEVRKRVDFPLYVTIEFENPEDPGAPFSVTTEVPPGVKEFQAESPFFGVLRAEVLYSVVVRLYRDAARTDLLGTHTQQVQFAPAPQWEALIEQKYNIKILAPGI